MPKGKFIFTKRDLDRIRDLIEQKCNAPASAQKTIRGKLRKELNFYISDFGSDINSVGEFDRLVESGVIKCGDSSPAVVDSSTVVESPVVVDKQSYKSGLPAVVGKDARILILGSLPGDESLRKQEYYSKPGNRFWKIMYSLYNADNIPGDYNDRIEFLKEHGVALWDVLSEAVREGSLDSNITQEKANDIGELIKLYPTIKIIAFNGKKAYEKFVKYYPKGLSDAEVRLITLYSTSGANKQYSDHQMLANWSKMLS